LDENTSRVHGCLDSQSPNDTTNMEKIETETKNTHREIERQRISKQRETEIGQKYKD
jgi:hypothetical protein